jgi:signal transduction histidine kinase
MQILFALYFFIFATIQFGLLWGTHNYSKIRQMATPNMYWRRSLTASFFAFLCFGLSTVFLEDFEKPQINFTVANTLFYVAALCQALFCRDLNGPLKNWQNKLAWISIVIFAVIFDRLRIGASYEVRLYFLVCSIIILLFWQVVELGKKIKVAPSPQLSYLQFATIGELIFAACRIASLITAANPIQTVDQVPAPLVLATLAQLVVSTLSYIAMSGYWTEIIAASFVKTQNENSDFKLLLDEREKLIHSLMNANKTVATGALSASIAHELNQPIAALNNNLFTLQLLLERYEIEDPVVKHILQDLRTDNARTADIVKALRALFKESSQQEAFTDLRQAVFDMLKIIEPECKQFNISLVVELAAGLSGPYSRIEIQQVLLNLISNALQSLKDSSVASPTIRVIGQRSEHFIYFSVTDNGQGVPDEFKPKLFDLLSSSKDSGLGVGLWLSQYIVEKYGGKIVYEGEYGERATFSFQLPIFRR